MVTQGGTHLGELVDQGLGMMEEETGLLGRASLRGSFHSDSLLAPDTDFMTDDRSSAASGLDVVDRLTYLEQRMQMQEDEIQLLKMTLADVLKRLNVSEEHQASTSSSTAATSGGRRAPGAKGSRPISLVLPPRNPMVHAASLKKSTTMPSSGMGRNYSPSPTPSKSSVKDTGCKAAKTRPTSAASTCKTAADSGSHKAKDPTVNVGTRRVTHCKVTMQIYLSPPARKTGSSENVASATPTTSFFTSSTTIASGSKRSSSSSSGPTGAPMAPGAGHGARGGSRSEGQSTRPGFTLNLQKTNSGQGLDTSSYKSPLKSPSQYFQICY
ncbi:unnamed protein product [Lota lota]